MTKKLILAAFFCNVVGGSLSFAAEFSPVTFNNNRVYFKNQQGNLENLPYLTLTLAAEEALEKVKEATKYGIDCQAITSSQNLLLSNSSGMTIPSVKIVKVWEVRDCKPQQ